MTLKASVNVVLGGHWGSAKRLLQAAERGDAATVTEWSRLAAALLDGRDGASQTPLMAACARGHAGVAAYLLAAGADPTLVDWTNLRSALHLAALGGHVGQAKFLDLRSYGGLTPLHCAVVTGSLEAVRVLLAAGAAIMVRTDGEAFVGSEFLVPGSTPLHMAVLMGHASIVHALLQAHQQFMGAMGQTLDARGRRPWEGSSRSDIRSVRNSLRRLPFHLARERGLPALQALVDPRVPIDVALDASRDSKAGIGPKRLSTLCAMCLQAALVDWLDACAAQAHQQFMGAMGQTLDARGRRPWEGSSRSDIRSVRNSLRRLPFHLARERGLPALQALVDPRVPIDVALDASRDSKAGIGPKRLSTLCAMCLQAALVDWLDACAAQTSQSVLTMLSTLRERMRSTSDERVFAALGDAADKGLEASPSASPKASTAEPEEAECGICLDAGVEVAFSGCEHALCLSCARHLTQAGKRPPHCPFCRRMVVGFTRVPAAPGAARVPRSG
ncbi:Putative E3 ubiquitin-protein ligase XBAT31 [Auxenochlorella protothecoides]|uniref:Putative E3 ubiquitin-protein ligase XBAT31 n=1 Tax=Auxenochlorella protothecoides TaxID=3075 RepID=A0A087SJJ7_AUXPR|nr:Putative E3 ubiquitin-protein ligase XBAT31 [Auxenochlorella protothecoides]KFM25901.1 Putative E3 ubiquitin-protein ligase XBAT31 [Auxenochlorella protothecoides]